MEQKVELRPIRPIVVFVNGNTHVVDPGDPSALQEIYQLYRRSQESMRLALMPISTARGHDG